MDIDGSRFLHDDQREEGAHSYFLSAGNKADTSALEATVKLEATQGDVAVKQEPGLGTDLKHEGAVVKEEAMQIG
jgi:hypothetical protein